MSRVTQGVIVLGVIALVSWMLFSGINSAMEGATKDREIAAFQQAARVKDHEINALIGLNRTLIADVRASNARTSQHDAASARKLTLVLKRLSALSRYVRSKGIPIPTQLLSTTTASGVAAPSSKRKHGPKK